MNVGSWPLLVIQGNRSTIAMSEGKVENSKLLINQWRNEQSSRDRLSHYLAFTKSAQEPNGIKLSSKQSQNRGVVEL